MTASEPAVRIVLVGTTHPGNIGAVARAMKNMCLSDLRLVTPKHFPHADATARAAGADDILAAARVHETLVDALAGCTLVAGASARRRSLAWPVVDAREFAGRAVREAARHPVAVVFGQERAGLTNEDMDCCHCLLEIPANPDFASLNLGMAVQIVAWELFMARRGAVPQDDTPPADSPPATADGLADLYAHLEQTLLDIEFLNPDNPRHLMRRLRRLYNRANLDENELNILRGILTAINRCRT